MKILIVVFILIYAFIPKSFGHGNHDNVRKAEAFQACVDDCMAFEQPGYALKACIESCKNKYLPDGGSQPFYCNTDEEDCERDDDDSEI